MKYPYLKRLPDFVYWAPETVEEALQLLSSHPEQAKIIAGGTDLLIKMKTREICPLHLIGLKKIPGLDLIRLESGGNLSLGPLVTVHAVETSAMLRENFPVLSQAASTLGSVQVRNLATVAGNLCTALPSADMAPGLIVLGARLKIQGLSAAREIGVEDFFHGPGVCALAAGEMVTEIRVPCPLPGSRSVYLKHMLRSAMDLSIVSVAAMVVLVDGKCRDARICLGTVGPTPVRAFNAEKTLIGQPLDFVLIEKAAAAASRECNPRSTLRASAEYRREMVQVLTRKALVEASTYR